MSLEPMYDPDRPCPKCGNPICASEFRPRGLFQPFDRMVRHCGRCEHRWYELPLDWTQERDDAIREARRMERARQLKPLERAAD